MKVTYAADWSEYHHTAGGWYNLDPLWASSNIDVIGIDAYFPLTNAPQDRLMMCRPSSPDGHRARGMTGITPIPARTIQAHLSRHTRGKISPGSGIIRTPIPTVHDHAGRHQASRSGSPNRFSERRLRHQRAECVLRSDISGSAFPYFSQGRVDFRAQRVRTHCRAGAMGGSSAWSSRCSYGRGTRGHSLIGPI